VSLLTANIAGRRFLLDVGPFLRAGGAGEDRDVCNAVPALVVTEPSLVLEEHVEPQVADLAEPAQIAQIDKRIAVLAGRHVADVGRLLVAEMLEIESVLDEVPVGGVGV
jgi:hypothetical protein